MTGFPKDGSADPAVQQPIQLCSSVPASSRTMFHSSSQHLPPPAPTVIPHTSAGVRVRKDVHDAPPQLVL